MPSFITTLGMIFVLNGLTLTISGAFPVETPGGETFFRFFGGSPYVTVYWALGVIVVMTILLTRTRWGLHTVATGGNLLGASESGVNVAQDQDRQLRPLQHARRARRHPRVGAHRHDPGRSRAARR